MSLPELFHHQHRFVGALGLRRQRRLQVGDHVGPYALDTSDAACYAALAAQILYPLPGQPDDLVLQAQAIASPRQDRCPALREDGLCQIHFDHKPRICSTVPLDPLLPDCLQRGVLATRSPGGADYLGADCVVRSSSEGFAPQTEGKVIVDAAARQALEARRRDLALDKRWWGNAIFDELQREVLSQSGGLKHVPAFGMTTLPLAPVLLILAARSQPCRRRCQIYVEAQIALIAKQIEQALRRKNPTERTFTAQLRHMAGTLEKLRTALPRATPGVCRDAPEIEHWLGLWPNPRCKQESIHDIQP
jgi:hypothetical protein